jgi:hypothetical protein
MRFRIYPIVGLVIAGYVAALLWDHWTAGAQTTSVSPLATSVALSTTSSQIIGVNPTRKAVTFCNPSAIIEWIAPAPLVPVLGGGIGIGLPAAATGTTVCFSTTVLAGSGQGQAWNGVSASATPNITVIEYP